MQKAGGFSFGVPHFAFWIRVLIATALVVGLLLRLKGLSLPPYDGHSFRQTQTLSTIEAFYADGIDLFHARTLYTGYPGVFVLELPLFQALAASLYHLLGPHLEIVRLLNIVFGSVTTWLLFRIVARMIDRRTALLSALIYWLAPLNVLYHRSMLLDPLAVMCGLASFYFLDLIVRPASEDERRSAGWRNFICLGVAVWLTAMIKALYLWPAVLLFAKACFDRRWKFGRDLLGVLAVFAVAGLSFVAWNRYATLVNDASPITRGVKPTSLLGVSALVSPDYYWKLVITRPRLWLGWISAAAYPIGFVVLLVQAFRRKHGPTLLLLAVPLIYLLLFANINHFHDYYQLIITPFLAIPAAAGFCWLGDRCAGGLRSPLTNCVVLTNAVAVFLAVSILTYSVWLGLPDVDPRKVRFQELCAGKVEPGSPAMVFVGRGVSGAWPNSYLPEYVYAAKLWGYGWSVDKADEAQAEIEKFSPGFQRLDYIVFYGTECPRWLPGKFRLVITDGDHQLYIFRQETD